MIGTIQQKRLDILDYGESNSYRPVQLGNKEFLLSETRKMGKARLTVKVSGEAILFSCLDEDGGSSRFLKNKKVADHLIVEYDEGRWKIHIFEMKRSVGGESWKEMKKQFFGGLIRAYEFCGILGIDFDLDSVFLYSAFYRDRFQEKDSLIDARIRIREREKANVSEWLEEKERVAISEGFVVRHRKIKLELNETGDCMCGSFAL